jgi:hypothetical protein
MNDVIIVIIKSVSGRFWHEPLEIFLEYYGFSDAIGNSIVQYGFHKFFPVNNL